MTRPSPRKLVNLAVVFCVAAITTLPAQTIQGIHKLNQETDSNPNSVTGIYSFCGSGCASGRYPGALIQGSDGNFYGTTEAGGSGSNGTIFQITPAGSLTVLYSFCSQPTCSDGELAEGTLLQSSDGNFYGTTVAGGANGRGTVFTITPGGAFTTLYSFCSLANCADGAAPTVGLAQGSDGNFYGVTELGGKNSSICGEERCGTIFSITPTGALTTLYSFCSKHDCADGGGPQAALVQGSDGNLYGTTEWGGANSQGTVFKFTPSGRLTTLYSFCSQPNCADGSDPSGALVQASNGNFYGVTQTGGTESYGGTVFQMTPAGSLTTLYNFCSKPNCRDGHLPAGLIVATNGNLYGTTYTGGTQGDGGTLFEMTTTGAFSSLYSFCGENDCSDANGQPFAVPTEAANGTFYSTTVGGGLYDDGLVYTFVSNFAATLTPSSRTFPSKKIGNTSSPRKVTFENTGTAILTIGSITASANFAVSSTTCGTTLNAGDKCTISVTFTPTTTGTITGTLTVSDNVPGSPQTVALSGTGT
jgi:uncharacterized repeat protein (TIGR03803 family)